MAKYRKNLPLLDDGLFITDGGLSTLLSFHRGIELPEFAAFVLLDDEEGRQILSDYFRLYAAMARKYEVGLVLESPTWRANQRWGAKIGYPEDSLARVNRESIDLLARIRDEYDSDRTPIVISGCMGPRGDGYVVTQRMSVDEAEQYHLAQVAAFADSDADLVTTHTFNYPEEAIGAARAAQFVGIPAAIGFTVETDGSLPSGQTLEETIGAVDEATGAYPTHYMINCAHPTHLHKALESDAPWKRRIRAVRANASSKSHAELEMTEELDDGDPVEFGRQFSDLRRRLANLNVVGGCCGTDHRHIEAICRAVVGTP